jgi:hypothetical protein
MAATDWDEATFEAHRPMLFSIAYRMAVMDLAAIPTFASDTTFHVVVESPRGSAVKLKYEPR